MQKEYKTILKEAQAEMEEKKSRFIASLKPVFSETEALRFINSVKAKYRDATHNVYAYYICTDNTVQRFSDDGEPSGTAGLPVMEMIRKMELMNLVIVVTRYFGGILLGASGLVRAYSKSALLGIEAAGIAKYVLCARVDIVVEYAMLGRLQNLIAAEGYHIKEIKYGQDAEITVCVPVGSEDKFVRLVEDMTSMRAVIEIRDRVYITV